MATVVRPWEIVTRRGRGPMMHFDGKKFTNNGLSKAFTFAEASSEARKLLRKYKILTQKGYHVWVRKIDWEERGRRKNPESLEQATQLLYEFSGHSGDKVLEVDQPTVKEGLVIGELDVLGYRTKREGVEGGRMVRYGHRFKKRSRPLLAVSKDGTQLLIVGGRYEFTEAGIEDR